ncbi:Uncharacterized protein MLTONO_p0562 (plasmid) [Mesorhizobium loti]|nr:Uncharacterized protein MLTONO_p0562 [Mesorhizobium loti]
MANRYSRDQLHEAIRRNIVTFDDRAADVQGNVGELRLHGFIDGLLLTLYLRHVEGKTLSRSQAWRLVPADHLDTCKKYVAEAERLGFIALVDDPHDGRRKNVVPTPKLIDHIEARARAALDAATAILQAGHLGGESKRRAGIAEK